MTDFINVKMKMRSMWLSRTDIPAPFVKSIVHTCVPSQMGIFASFGGKFEVSNTRFRRVHTHSGYSSERSVIVIFSRSIHEILQDLHVK